MSGCNQTSGATVFGYKVTDPDRYRRGRIRCRSCERFPSKKNRLSRRSNYAVTGLYFYDNDVVRIAKAVKPSARGELEITDVNNAYLQRGDLHVEQLGRGFAWLDTGTHDSLMEAAGYVQTVEKRQGLKVACLEEIGFHNGWLCKEQLLHEADKLRKTEYGRYLLQVAAEAG